MRRDADRVTIRPTAGTAFHQAIFIHRLNGVSPTRHAMVTTHFVRVITPTLPPAAYAILRDHAAPRPGDDGPLNRDAVQPWQRP